MKKTLLALSSGIMLASLGKYSFDTDSSIATSETPKKQLLPLTEEETERLKGLNRKEKRQYLRELKEKYDS